MSYLNLQYKDNFQKLCAAMPLFYLDVYEMREILRAQGRLLDGTCAGLELIIDNNFVVTADEETIEKLEAALKLTHDRTLTLEQRRNAVMARISGYGHIGEPEIREVIGYYTDGAVTVGFRKGIIYITIEGEVAGEDNLVETLLSRIPAHLALKIRLDIRRSFRQNVEISLGGAAGSWVLGEPKTRERISSKQEIMVTQGLTTSGHVRGEPVTAERISSEVAVDVGLAGLVYGKTTPDTPEVKKRAEGSTASAGGLYCYTHTKSKLIE